MTRIPKVRYIDVNQLVDILAMQLDADRSEADERRRPPAPQQAAEAP